MTIGRSAHHFGQDGNILKVIGWFAMIFCTDIQCPQRMNFNNSDDSLTFYLAPSVGQSFHLSVKYDTIYCMGLDNLHSLFPLFIQITLVIPNFSSTAIIRSTFVVWNDMSQQLLGGLV